MQQILDALNSFEGAQKASKEECIHDDHHKQCIIPEVEEEKNL
jgi:hypothetical protein